MNKLKGIGYSCLLAILLMLAECFGVSANQTTFRSFGENQGNPDWSTATSVYVELGGKFISSLNIDFRKKENFAYCFGISYWYDTEGSKQSIFVPSVNGYMLLGERYRLEIGGGIGQFIGTDSGFASAMIFSNIGYRYQKKNGLIFRIGFTPWMAIPLKNDARFAIVPWAGVSLGYCF